MNDIDIFADLPSDRSVLEERESDLLKLDRSREKSGRTFFDCLKVIYQTKDVQQMESDISEPNFNTFYSKYMCQRYLSFCPVYLDLIKNYQHVLESMSNENHYRFLVKIIPKNPRLWIRYIAKKKRK